MKTFLKSQIKDSLAFLYSNFWNRFRPMKGNRILMYHAVGSTLSHDTYGLSMDKNTFRDHMLFLKNEATVIPLQSLLTSQLNDEPTAIITFDDGYKDNLDAAEICSDLGLPFTIFVTTQWIDKPQFLSTEDLQILSANPLCTLGSHSHTHPRLGDIPIEEAIADIQISKSILEDILGKHIETFACPHGSFSSELIKALSDTGFKIGCTSQIGVNLPGHFHPLMLKRTELIAKDDVRRLERKIRGDFDFMSIFDMHGYASTLALRSSLLSKSFELPIISIGKASSKITRD